MRTSATSSSQPMPICATFSSKQIATPAAMFPLSFIATSFKHRKGPPWRRALSDTTLNAAYSLLSQFLRQDRPAHGRQYCRFFHCFARVLCYPQSCLVGTAIGRGNLHFVGVKRAG